MQCESCSVISWDEYHSRCFNSLSNSATRTSVLLRWRRFAGGANTHCRPAFAHLWHWDDEFALGRQRTLDTRQASHALFNCISPAFFGPCSTGFANIISMGIAFSESNRIFWNVRWLIMELCDQPTRLQQCDKLVSTGT